jgi:hypothetical protein
MDLQFLSAFGRVVGVAAIAGLAVGAVPVWLFFVMTHPGLRAARVHSLVYVAAGLFAASVPCTIAAVAWLPAQWTLLVPLVYVAWVATAFLPLLTTSGRSAQDANPRLAASISTRWLIVLLMSATLVAAVPFGLLVVRQDPCLGVEWMLVTQRSDGRGAAALGFLPNLLPRQLGSEARLVVADKRDLTQEAATKRDPDTAAELRTAGFQGAFHLGWADPSGRGISAEVMEFGNQAGALFYHRTVSRYACQFANAAYGSADGGLGLEVRYSTGDPISEQIAWVDGARRFVVSRTYLAVPADLEQILELAARVRAQSRDEMN